MLLSFLVVSLLFCISCKQDSEPEHVHTWGNPVVTKTPTCTEKGSQTLTCTGCGEKVAEDISATGHSFSSQWAHDDSYHWHGSSCEHAGLKGSFEPHTWDTSQVIKASTCEEEGIIRYTCKCGVSKDESIPKHTFATTWTSDDDYHWHAATCEHTDQVLEKAEHIWGSVSKSGSKATYTCNVCGAKVEKNLPDEICMVMAGPGEESSKQAVISWHSTSTGSCLEYRIADSEDWIVVANELCNETKSTAKWVIDSKGTALAEKPYVCKVYLDGLAAGSSYKYRIKTVDGHYSEVATFRTAEEDTTYFQFAWMSDIHTPSTSAEYINRIGEIVNYSNAKNGVDIDFVLFTGDIAEKGQRYDHWKNWSDSGLMNNMTYAFLVGNHDYYPYDSKDRTTNAYYKDFAAYPANNDPEGDAYVLDSNYWFIWNRVMFVCIDNFTSEGSETSSQEGSSLSAQISWFKAVVDANAGNYDYLIFAQHLPFFDSKDTAPCSYGNFNSWYKIFDQYKVDFALSSDEHTYRRSYPLYNKKSPSYYSETNPDAEKAELIDGKVSKGTVYVVSNHTEGASLSSLKNDAKNMKYIEYRAGGVGGVYFTVTPTEMTLHLIGSGGREYDTITVLKKDRSK